MTAETYTDIPYGPHRKPWRETLAAVAVSVVDGTLLVSAPCSDPLCAYRVPSGVTGAFYQVPSSGLTHDEHDRAMEEAERIMKEGCESFFGFMVSQNFENSRFLHAPLTSVAVNNAGDPFTGSSPHHFMPKWVERNVLDYFASLWHAKWPHDPKDPDTYWGYVLTMGSTEGNMHALWSARNYLSGDYIQTAGRNGVTNSSQRYVVTREVSAAKPVNATPVLLFSQNSNFSLKKLSDIVNLPLFNVVGEHEYPNENPLGGEWEEGVPCTGGDAGPGTIDTDALEKLVDFFSGKGHPIVVIFNYGTTLKGACDDVQAAGERLVKVLKKNNMYERKLLDPDNPAGYSLRKGFWFHIDGALSAAYMPFLEMAYKNDLTDIKPASVFDFRLDFVSSIVTSGHKFIGTPWPCGVYLMRNQNGMRLHSQKQLPVTGAYDTTLSTSRNAHSSFLLWSYISNSDYDTQVASVLQCLQLVDYTVNRLKDLQSKVGLDLWISNFPPSLSIMFRRPNPQLVSRYTLTTSTLNIDSEVRSFAQIYIMRHATAEKINSFIQNLEAPDAFAIN